MNDSLLYVLILVAIILLILVLFKLYGGRIRKKADADSLRESFEQKLEASCDPSEAGFRRPPSPRAAPVDSSGGKAGADSPLLGFEEESALVQSQDDQLFIEHPIELEVLEDEDEEEEDAARVSVQRSQKDAAALKKSKQQDRPVQQPVVASSFRGLGREAYDAWINGLEANLRSRLEVLPVAKATASEREQMQRELVVLNMKLAQLDESYKEEQKHHQEVANYLAQLVAKEGVPQAEQIRQGLFGGEDPRIAEEFLDQFSRRSGPGRDRAAFYSGMLAELRVDLHTALERYRVALQQRPQEENYLRSAGKIARILYRYKEAVSWLEALVLGLRSKAAQDPLAYALGQRELAHTYLLSGLYQKSAPLYKESMRSIVQLMGEDHPEMAASWFQLGELQETMGIYDKAAKLYERCLSILQKQLGEYHPTLAPILEKLAALYMEMEQEPKALPLYQRLTSIREQTLRPTHPQLAMSLDNLAEAYRLQGKYAEAEACYLKSLVINEAIYGKQHPNVAVILRELGKLCKNQRKHEEAQRYHEMAAAMFQHSMDEAEKNAERQSLTLEL